MDQWLRELSSRPGIAGSPYSLQNAISSRNTDIKILSVGPVPEIEL